MTASALSQISSELNRGLVHHQQGELDQARRVYHNVLKRAPDDVDALRLLATLEMQRSRHREAEQLAAQALAAAPAQAATQNTMGQVLSAQGRFDEAREYFAAALNLDASLANARANLGRCLLRSGQLRAGIEALCAAAEREPGDAALACEIATVLMRAGDHAGAERYFLLALEWAPNNQVSYLNLGAFYIDQNRADQAVPYLTRAIELNAQAPSAWMNLSRALRMLGEFAAALECLDQLLTLQPGNPDAVAFAASIHHQTGDYDEAWRCFTSVLSEHPEHAMSRQGLAELHEWRGEYVEAVQCLSPLIESDSFAPETAVTYARALRRMDRQEEAIELLEQILSSANASAAITKPLLKQLQFTLAGLYDDQARYDVAWEHVSTANALETNTFDIALHHEMIERITQRAAITNVATASHCDTDVQPVFIVGMPRSGTSLVEQILAAHPQVHALGESGFVGVSLPDGYPYIDALPASADTDRVRAAFASHTEGLSSEKLCVTEKTPLNFLLLDVIAQAFPNARIIHCTRHALDTMLSCYFTDFRSPGLAFTADLDALAQYYADYQRLMAHWSARLELRVLDLSYEDLVSDPQEQIRYLLEFVGLDWDDRCREHHRVARAVHTASHAQVREPIYTRACGRWRNYAEHLNCLRSGLSAPGLAGFS
mgnify:CR=1 FL=1